MIQELLYTSHKGEGLRPGSGGGYCTVVCTHGMPSNIVRILEQLSGYRHPFDIHDRRSLQNPILYRSISMPIGGVNYAILSRVADVRNEHSGRSNKLAHHVILSESEFVEAGPAAILSMNGFCVTDWDGVVREVLPRRSSELANVGRGESSFRLWALLAGDSGWAGTVAEELVRTQATGNSVRVIFPLGTDCLGLCTEVYEMIPPAKRWQITFSTYGTDSNSPCHLNFILDGTREATIARKDKRKLVIDLTDNIGEPKDTDFVRAARSGDISKLQRNVEGRLKKSPFRTLSASKASSDRVDDHSHMPSGKEVKHSPPELKPERNFRLNELSSGMPSLRDEDIDGLSISNIDDRRKQDFPSRQSGMDNAEVSRRFAFSTLVVAVSIAFLLVSHASAIFLGYLLGSSAFFGPSLSEVSDERLSANSDMDKQQNTPPDGASSTLSTEQSRDSRLGGAETESDRENENRKPSGQVTQASAGSETQPKQSRVPEVSNNNEANQIREIEIDIPTIGDWQADKREYVIGDLPGLIEGSTFILDGLWGIEISNGSISTRNLVKTHDAQSGTSRHTYQIEMHGPLQSITRIATFVLVDNRIEFSWLDSALESKNDLAAFNSIRWGVVRLNDADSDKERISIPLSKPRKFQNLSDCQEFFRKHVQLNQDYLRLVGSEDEGRLLKNTEKPKGLTFEYVAQNANKSIASISYWIVGNKLLRRIEIEIPTGRSASESNQEPSNKIVSDQSLDDIEKTLHDYISSVLSNTDSNNAFSRVHELLVPASVNGTSGNEREIATHLKPIVDFWEHFVQSPPTIECFYHIEHGSGTDGADEIPIFSLKETRIKK
ncbi:MAG TPA: hypothetical protein PKD64_09230 [Pirellulaceae bacterium]|nr:hypothetical protein [Pirellulaceae bacterium]HMO92370.1 hypothetical protein [Pirellulaceae bacterium]HMP70767.1 hypothetical protein [Pirellulaceae bacterium]